MAMMSLVGGDIGIIFCLYSLMFRWNVVVGKYGRISLYAWVLAVTAGCSLVGYLADLAIWGVRFAIWRASS